MFFPSTADDPTGGDLSHRVGQVVVENGAGHGEDEETDGEEDEAAGEETAFAETPVEAQLRQSHAFPERGFGIQKTDPEMPAFDDDE